MLEWKGIFPALTTPFTAKDELDLSMFEKNLNAQMSAGVSGVIIGGSLGEASTLTTSEKETLVKFSLEKTNKRISVILNIAENSTRDSLQQARLAKEWKVQGLMLLPPMRYKSDERETVGYLKTIANATDLPIMIYNNPVDYKIEVTPDMFQELTECKKYNCSKRKYKRCKQCNANEKSLW